MVREDDLPVTLSSNTPLFNVFYNIETRSFNSRLMSVRFSIQDGYTTILLLLQKVFIYALTDNKQFDK